MKRRGAILLTAIGILLGVALGVGAYTFVYAKGYSYMTTDPAACANCHVMEGHFSAWLVSSHRSVAACNDCHTPPGLVGKYMTKASNGFWHSFAFTTGWFHQPIQIKQSNREITESTCRHCHANVTATIDGIEGHREEGRLSCIRCHSTVGHIE